jgi:hypothetical protein
LDAKRRPATGGGFEVFDGFAEPTFDVFVTPPLSCHFPREGIKNSH